MFNAALEARYEYVFPLVLSETLPICMACLLQYPPMQPML